MNKLLTEQEKAYLEDSLKDIRHGVQSIRFRQCGWNRVEVVVEMETSESFYDLVLPNNVFAFKRMKKYGRYTFKQLGLFEEVETVEILKKVDENCVMREKNRKGEYYCTALKTDSCDWNSPKVCSFKRHSLYYKRRGDNVTKRDV